MNAARTSRRSAAGSAQPTQPAESSDAPGGHSDPFDDVTAQDLVEETQRAVGAAFRRFTERRQRARANPFGLSMSSLGGCLRQAAYRISGVEPSDPELAMSGENRQAGLGTMAHDGLLEDLAAELDGQAEVPVTLSALDQRTGQTDEITGTADVVSELRHGVWDLKTVSEYGLERVLTGGARPSNRIQAGGYALACHQNGIRVDWVTYLYMDRSTGKALPVTEEFGQRLVTDVVARVWLVQSYRARPDLAPRTEPGPGLSVLCDGCGWLTRCWGVGARPGVTGPQRVYGRDRRAVAAALAEYMRCRAKIRELEDEKEFWAAVFERGSRPGAYGSYRWWRGRDGEVVDKEAVVAAARERGEALPMKNRRGSLYVKPA